MSGIEKKTEAMGLALPAVPAPIAAYVPALQSGRTSTHRDSSL